VHLSLQVLALEVLFAGLFVFLKTRLDIVSLRLFHKLLILHSHHIAHPRHDLLNLVIPISNLLLALGLLELLIAHLFNDQISVFFLRLLQQSHPLPLFSLILNDN